MSTNLELAGLVDDDGSLGRPVPSGKIIVPENVWLEGDAIRWEMGSGARLKTVSRNMLDEFVRLSNANSVLRFAKNWGVLALSGENVLRPGREPKSRAGTEPISAWLYYARHAKALLNIVASLKENRMGDMSDWNDFATFIPEGRGVTPENREALQSAAERMKFGLRFSAIRVGATFEENVQYARSLVAREIEHWLDLWKVGRAEGLSDFALRWDDTHRRWDLQIDYHGLLFAAIALQLALVVADADSLYSCSGCGIPYIRPRGRKRPKSGWANYCNDCSKGGVAQRHAVETYRQKVAEAVSLHSAGTAVSEIAERLKAQPARVRGWIKKGGKDGKAKAR